MSSSDLLLGLFGGLLLGAGAAAYALRLRLAEKDRAIEESRRETADERNRSGALQTELRDAIQARARMEGELTHLTRLQEELEAREETLQSQVQAITALREKVADANRTVEEVKTSRDATIQRMEEDVQRRIQLVQSSADTLIREKEEALQRILREKEVALAEQQRLLNDAEKRLGEAFGAVSLESLQKAQEQFLKLATERFEKVDETSKAEMDQRRKEIEGLLKPLSESLDKLEKGHKEMEERRVSAFDAIEKGIHTLAQEADQLANALRKPNSRGAWGEMQLQVILENAGMHEGEHFVLQHSTEGDDGRLRTDVVIKLPKGRMLVIDSKAPLESYWTGMNAPDEATRTANFAAHARLVRDHVKKLSGKAYWARYPSSPDCVVMFIPTEGAYQAAFEADRSLLSDAHGAGVYLANPMTLISMVHIAAYILREERISQEAEQVRALGTELYKRLSKFLGDLESMGQHLKRAVGSYNEAVGSIEGRVLPTARDMAKLGAGANKELPTPVEVQELPRRLRHRPTPELPEAPSLGLLDS